jgi:hypothetical protein
MRGDAFEPLTDPDPHATSPPRRRIQLPLRTLLLIVAATAVWMAVATNRRQIHDLSAGLESIRPLARELLVKVPGQWAVIQRHPTWFDEAIWDVHVPAGGARLALATRELRREVFGSPPGAADFPIPPAQMAPVTPGRHTIALEKSWSTEGWRVVVLLDGEAVLSRSEPAEWDPGVGSSGGARFSTLTQRPAEEPLVLYHRRFMVRDDQGRFQVPDGPGPGILLRLEPAS